MLVRLDPDRGRDGGDVAPARPAGRDPRPRHATRSTPPTRSAAPKLTVRDGRALLDLPINHVVNVELRRLPARGQPPRLRLRRRRPALLQRQRPAGRRRRQLRDDRPQARLPEAVRQPTRWTTCATATSTTTSCAPRASRTSCARPRTRSASASCSATARSCCGSSRATRRPTSDANDAAILRPAQARATSRRRTRSHEVHVPGDRSRRRRATSTISPSALRARPSSSSSTRGVAGAGAQRRRGTTPKRARKRGERRAARARRSSRDARTRRGLRRCRSRRSSPRLPGLLPAALRLARGSYVERPSPRAYDIYDRTAAAATAPTGSSLYAGRRSASTTASRARPGRRRRSSTTRPTTCACAAARTSCYFDGSRLRLVAWQTPNGRLLGLQHARRRR